MNDWSTKLRTEHFSNSSKIQSLEVIKEDKIIKIFKSTEDFWNISESNSSDTNAMIADRNKIQSFFRELNSASIEQFLTTSIDEKSREEFKVDNPIYRINILYQNSKSNSYYLSRMQDTEQMWTVIDQNQSIICLVQTNFNKLLDINPLTFRNKSLLPKNFVSNFVSIQKYDSNTSIKIDTSQSTKDDNSLLNFRAEAFINSYFLEDGTWIEATGFPGNIICHFVTQKTTIPMKKSFV